MVNIVSHGVPCGALTTNTVVLAQSAPNMCELNTLGQEQHWCVGKPLETHREVSP